MQCSHCGKSVSIVGKVCPWCGADKTKDAQLYVIAMVFAMLSGVFTFLFTDNPLYAFGGAIVAMIVVATVGAFRRKDQ